MLLHDMHFLLLMLLTTEIIAATFHCKHYSHEKNDKTLTAAAPCTCT